MSRLSSPYAALPVLLLCLLFLTGIASTAVALSGSAAPDVCCEQESQQPSPADDFACTDMECSCVSCSVSILNLPLALSTQPAEPQAPCWLLLGQTPSDHVRSIDYPPEPA